MRYFSLIAVFMFLSCSPKKTLQLPEIKNAEITEVLDVSPAYIFYDETLPDSTEFNRKNLISTTNWLVNVDKRLTLKQAIPHLQYLQNKRRKASMHKNENAKNYFTCNDTSIKNLGFLEFTKMHFKHSKPVKSKLNFYRVASKQLNETTKLEDDLNNIPIIINNETIDSLKDEIEYYTDLLTILAKVSNEINLSQFSFHLYFDQNLSFQDYISVKSLIKDLEINISFDTTEHMY